MFPQRKWLPLQPDFQNAFVMDAFIAYSIPVQGLKIGVHRFQYNIDKTFFRHFEEAPIDQCQIQFTLTLDKRADMLIFDFALVGTVQAECDRCTAVIQLPIEYERQLIVKYGESEGETEDEVAFIPREASDINVAKYLYEFSVLALPITNTYDCRSDANPPCNEDILKFLEKTPDETQSNTIWDALKGFNGN